jgi:hypothetical protein
MKKISVMYMVITLLFSLSLAGDLYAKKMSVKTVGDIKVSIYTEPSPPKIGTNVFRVVLKDKKGKVIKDAEVEISAMMPSMSDMSSSGIKALLTKSNEYAAPVSLGMNGDWKVVVKIKTADKKVSEIFFEFRV